MTDQTSARPEAATDVDDSAPTPRRDAARTRALLIAAARKRFAREGYANATVRDITSDAGVNVALVNRYFTSKEGLFAACLVGTVDGLERSVPERMELSRVPHAIAAQLASPRGRDHEGLLLLLQSSGDARADGVRLDILRSFAERLAGSVDQNGDVPGTESVMLRAQVALAAALGMALLRSTTALEPLASADQDDLAAPLHDLVVALLGPTG